MNASGAGAPTIYAVSSGAPPAAIAVIRISGERAGPALAALAGRMPVARRATLARLRDADDATLDHALILWFPGPATVTGEDLAELHLHGGRAVIAAVLSALASQPGLALAEAGAFTRRALLNGRIGLSEAEGLADLLAAETEGQRRQALRLAEGGLARLIDGWRSRLLIVAATIEAMIDYEDEGDVPANDDPVVARSLAIIADEIGDALARPPAERLRDGVRIVVAGPPNAGKSTLINALAERDVAIVSPVAGTTRDLIEAPTVFGGLPCLLIDSAGLHATADPVERLGLDRAHIAIDGADIVLWLGEPDHLARPPSAIVLHPRCDVAGRGAAPADRVLAISAMRGDGMDQLRALLADRARSCLPPASLLALHARHRGLLQVALGELIACGLDSDPLLVAEHIRTCLGVFDRVVGHAGVEDMLDALFSRFCVGK